MQDQLFTSLSAVDKRSAESFMKVLLTLVMAYEFDYDASYRRKFTLWCKESEAFIKRFKFPTRNLSFAQREILKEVDPNDEDSPAGQKLNAAISKIMIELADKRDAMKKELDLRKEDLSLLNDLRLIHTKDSESARRRLSRIVSRFGDPDLSGMFVQEHADISNERKELEELVRKHTGKPGLDLPPHITAQWTEIKKKKGAYLPAHRKYLDLRAVLRTAYKTRLQAIVRSSGKPYLPVHEVADILTREGITHSLPSGFVGMIDDSGKFYTTSGLLILGSPSGDVRMNPAYRPDEDNAYVCEYTPAFAEQVTRAYTESFRSRKKEQKFGVVMETLPQLPKLVKKWRADMKNLKKSAGVLATLCDFIYATSARVSNPNAATGGERTFGATQLLVSHIMVDDHKVSARYIGKSGGAQHHIIDIAKKSEFKLLHANMKKLVAGKKKGDPVFALNGKTFTGTQINKYLRSIGFPDKFTIHKLRTARGTQMASDLLKESKFKKGAAWTERDVNQWVEGTLLKVGIELGHMSGEKYTSNTAIQNYIQPEVLGEFYNKLGIRPPAKIQKAIDGANKHKNGE